MKKPYPTDYGLTEEEIKRFENYQGKLEWSCILGFPAIPAAFLIMHENASWFYFPLYWFICLPFGAMIGYGISSILVRILFPRHTRYLAAIEKYTKWFVRTQKEFWNSLDGRSFEHEVSSLLKRAGYKAKLTDATGDKGVDIFLGDGTIVQCKAHKSPISPAVVRELYGTLKHFGAPKAILISKSGFTKGVYEFIRGKPISLWDLSNLVGLQKKLDE